MVSWIFIFLAVTTIVLGYFLTPRNKKGRRLPPGPKGIPFIGNLHQVEKRIDSTFIKWSKEHGPICMANLFGIKILVLGDPKYVKEAFSEQNFSGRQDLKLFDMLSDGKAHGIVISEGHIWSENRRWTLKNLRDFGFGKSTLEESIMIEVNELIQGIKEDENKSIGDMKSRLILAVVNALWHIVAGTRQSQKDAELIAMNNKVFHAVDETFKKGKLLIFFPWLAKIAPNLSGYTTVRHAWDEFAAHIAQVIQEHKKTYSDGHVRDLIDLYLKHQSTVTDPSSPFFGKFGDDNLFGLLGDIYLGGTDTTGTSLNWLILYLSKLPNVQKKLQQEIESVTGNTRPVSVSDRLSMPFASAVISETLRHSSIFPVGVNHRATVDMEFKGYLIPKDTLIAANLYYIHHDPKIWGDDADEFRPERFISPDGTFKKHEALLAFSTGKRACLGESLARDSLWLFSTNIFQRFNVEFDKNGPDHGFESKEGGVLAPKPFRVIFKDRLM